MTKVEITPNWTTEINSINSTALSASINAKVTGQRSVQKLKSLTKFYRNDVSKIAIPQIRSPLHARHLFLAHKEVQIKTNSHLPGTGDLSSAFHLCNPKPRKVCPQIRKKAAYNQSLKSNYVYLNKSIN